MVRDTAGGGHSHRGKPKTAPTENASLTVVRLQKAKLDRTSARVRLGKTGKSHKQKQLEAQMLQSQLSLLASVLGDKPLHTGLNVGTAFCASPSLCKGQD